MLAEECLADDGQPAAQQHVRSGAFWLLSFFCLVPCWSSPGSFSSLCASRPEWFSAIASGDIMKIKMMVAKKTIDLKTKYKEDMMAAFSFGDASKGANIFTPRKSDQGARRSFVLTSFSKTKVGFAVYHDQNHIIELLLQGGADKTDTFEVGGVTYAPLDYAEQKGKKKALKTLQTYKIKVQQTLVFVAEAIPFLIVSTSKKGASGWQCCRRCCCCRPRR